MYVKEETNASITIEKSVFICYLKHVESEEEYKSYLSLIRKKHYDATHVCSAFVCDNIQRSSDDGEPSGTAGAPILNVLLKNNLNQMCAIVVRYFGGIKLGAGGLIRAYSNAVSDCLKQGILVEDIVYPKYQLSVSYELGNKIENFLRNNTILLDTKYDLDICYEFALDDLDKIDRILEYTKGIQPKQIGEKVIQKVVK